MRRYRSAVWLAGLALVAGALALAGSGNAALAADPPVNTVTVQGQGIVTAAPDTAIVRLGVALQAGSVADARAQAAGAAAAVVSAVKADGVADRDIQTVQININPVYSNQNNQQVLSGYRAENVLQIRVRTLTSTGQVIDDAVAAGGNAAVVQSIQFTIDDPTSLAHQARLLAIQDAQNRANDYASALGLTVGRAVLVVEQAAPPPAPVPAAAPLAAVAAPRAPTPVEGGTLQIQVQVTVSFLLQ